MARHGNDTMRQTMHLLIVEDSAPTRDLLTRALEDTGATVETAARLSTGIRLGLTGSFDVIVLDLMLPDGNGLDLCRELRAAGVTIPILCLSARGEVADRVNGLQAGADDYLRKPFALAELRARIVALARRGGQVPPSGVSSGAMRIDFAARRITRRSVPVPLTAREWAVLETLASRAGRVVTRSELLELVWSEVNASASDSLNVILGRLRRKLGSPEEGCVIRTVRGEGYVFETVA